MTLFSRINKDCPWVKFSIHLVLPKIGADKYYSQMGEGDHVEYTVSFPTEATFNRSDEHFHIKICFFGFGVRIFRQWSY